MKEMVVKKMEGLKIVLFKEKNCTSGLSDLIMN